MNNPQSHRNGSFTNRESLLDERSNKFATTRSTTYLHSTCGNALPDSRRTDSQWQHSTSNANERRKMCPDSERGLTSTAGGGAAEPSPSPGDVEPRKQEELGSCSRLLARRPLPLPFSLLTSSPTSDAAEEDDDEEEEEDEAALLLPDPIAHQPGCSTPHRGLQIRGSARGACHCPASLPRGGAWVRVAACATPRWARTGTSAAAAPASPLLHRR